MRRPALSNLDSAWHRHIEPEPDTLFHYTTQKGLKGILSARCLRATDVRHLNDKVEFEYGRRMAIRKLRDIRHRLFPPFIDEISAALRLLRKTPPRAYAASLAVGGDLLSLWRGYCQKGDGFAIGFSKQELEKLARRRGWQLKPVVYSPAAQWERLQHLEAAAARARGPKANPVRFARSYLKGFQQLAPFLKEPSFFEEGEWRIMPRFKKESIRYRKGTRGRVAYVPLPLSPSTIKLILVGPDPSPQFGAREVSAFCARIWVHVRVYESTVPLRAK